MHDEAALAGSECPARTTRRTFTLLWERMPLAAEPESIFMHLYAGCESSFWLDSSLVQEGLSRFSFMGDLSGPHAHTILYDVTTQRVRTYAAGGATPATSGGSIFTYLQDVFDATDLDTSGSPPIPFTGGYVGYFGYELKSLTNGVSSHTAPTPDAAFHFADRFVAIDAKARTLYLVVLHEAGSQGAKREAGDWIAAMTQRLSDVPEPAPAAPLRAAPDAPIRFELRHHRRDYIARIESCLDLIGRGESYEICLCNSISADIEVDDLQLYRILRRRNPAPYSALLRFPGFAVASSSPERFLSIDVDGNVETKPIKGTAARHSDAIEDAAIRDALQSDEKSRSENLMIVDLLRNDLGKVCRSGSVHVPELMHVESYATVHQLVTTVRGRLRADETPLGCVAACFPGGSMTGAPKRRTLEIIDRLEGAARGVYSGALGYLSLSGAVDLNIVIRTVVVEPKRVSIGCGGAIVALSDKLEEFDEILLKARAPIRAVVEAATGDAEADYSLIGTASQTDTSRRDAPVPINIRPADTSDAIAVSACVERLLSELGGLRADYDRAQAERCCATLIAHPDDGIVLVAEHGQEPGNIVGVALVSITNAVRRCGRYGILQELWVAPSHRADGLGQRLLTAIDAEMQARSLSVLEVSLPVASGAEAARVTRFYEKCGFSTAGTRMRRRY